MNGWMDEWVVEKVNGRVDVWIDEWTENGTVIVIFNKHP